MRPRRPRVRLGMRRRGLRDGHRLPARRRARHRGRIALRLSRHREGLRDLRPDADSHPRRRDGREGTHVVLGRVRGREAVLPVRRALPRPVPDHDVEGGGRLPLRDQGRVLRGLPRRLHDHHGRPPDDHHGRAGSHVVPRRDEEGSKVPVRRGLRPGLPHGPRDVPLRDQGRVLRGLPRGVQDEPSHRHADDVRPDVASHGLPHGAAHPRHGGTVAVQPGRIGLRLHGPAVVHGEFRPGVRDEGRVLRGQRLSRRVRGHDHRGTRDCHRGSRDHYRGGHHGGAHDHYRGDYDDRHHDRGSDGDADG
mmetsp:Transcript_6788/g.15455  ORF Transcript_6788/g.15455 Transcript_6788/m.15455 type:complete len:306 (-) Transcript_6788:427-1344(-)